MPEWRCPLAGASAADRPQRTIAGLPLVALQPPLAPNLRTLFFRALFRLPLVAAGYNPYSIAPSGRGTEAAIPAPTRNRLGALPPHGGSNPTLSANQ